MQITEFTLVSQSRNGRKAMIVYKKDKKSITRHAVKTGGFWTYESFKEDEHGNKKRAVFEEFMTPEQQTAVNRTRNQAKSSKEEHENDADMALAHEEGN